MNKAAYRILDANFNRAREACRVIEEYARFVLDHDSLSARAKSVRHRISRAMTGFEPEKLIHARDSEGDVGRSRIVSGQIRRKELCDCVTAAFKRLSEALRSLYEYAEVLRPGSGDIFESLRFEGYTLEKEFACLLSTVRRFADVRLYVLVNVYPDSESEQVLELIQACGTGGADCIQLRAKGLHDRRLAELSESVFGLCGQLDILGILNDRADIADLTGAHGVHLGQDDLTAGQVRDLTGRDMVIGISTHNADELADAIAQKPAYVALGSVFPSTTKPDVEQAGLEYVRFAKEKLDGTGIFSVAIGGITEDNAGSVIQAGADAVAVSAAVTESRDPEGACQALKRGIEAAL